MEEHPESLKNPASLISYRYINKSVSMLPNLKQFKNLTELDLSGNSIEGDIKELYCLKYLRKLSLSANHITEFGRFPLSLEYLNLSCNHISQIKDARLPRLIYLDLTSNLISKIESLFPFQQLKTLYLGYNLIRDLTCLVDFPNLIEIDLEHNLLSTAEAMKGLVENGSLIVFIIKKNSGYRDFVSWLAENRFEIPQRNDVFCKDFSKAAGFGCRLLKEGFGGSTETSRFSRIYSEYMSHVSQNDIIREQDEFNDGLLNEVAELRKIIQQKSSESKKHRNFQLFKLERQLMRLAEIDRKNLIDLKNSPEFKLNSKLKALKTKSEKLEKSHRELQSELSRKVLEMNSIGLEKYRIESDFIYLKQENESLRQQVESLTNQISFFPNKKIIISKNKKLLKSNSTKIGSSSTIPSARVTKKDSLIISPLSGASFPAVAQAMTKREKSVEREGVFKKNKLKLEKPVRMKRSIIN